MDPTGAGDVFAGAFVGALAREGRVGWEEIKKAVACGTVAASFVIEDFSLQKLVQIKDNDIASRLQALKKMVGLP